MRIRKYIQKYFDQILLIVQKSQSLLGPCMFHCGEWALQPYQWMGFSKSFFQKSVFCDLVSLSLKELDCNPYCFANSCTKYAILTTKRTRMQRKAAPCVSKRPTRPSCGLGPMGLVCIRPARALAIRRHAKQGPCRRALLPHAFVI